MNVFFHSASQDDFGTLDDCLDYLRPAFFYLKRSVNRLLIWFIALLSSLPYLTPTPFTVDERNNGVHLAVAPRCGSLVRGSRPSDINVGIELGNDSYTDGGNDDGSPLEPPVLIPPSVLAGGRSANGPVWIEGIANDTGATLMSYAQWGACIDLSIWPSNPRKVDFLGQMQTFLAQAHTLDSNATLYSLFFGINDYGDSKHDGDRLHEAAQVLLEQIRILYNPPTNARSFLVLDVYGQGEHSPEGESFKQTIYDGLISLHEELAKLRFAYVDFGNIWDGVLGPTPGYDAFGFTSKGHCTDCWWNCDKYGWCRDPDHHFYWIYGHPSKNTHRVMADYVLEVLNVCQVI
ncbi:hypothetical protein BDZ89DRAFT_1065642 [Hymenopellis radicata]|nr:hypothetical protein BDZ89DRAFT_1065642 [Hymenopellis radicata]